MTKRFLIFPWLFSLLSFRLVAGSFTFTTIDFPGSILTFANGSMTVGRWWENIRPMWYITAFC